MVCTADKMAQEIEKGSEMLSSMGAKSGFMTAEQGLLFS